ncbi:MAG TPA: DoxX family protein, partial [Gemmatimonadaceae bacterium]|nr:DoxX family protein [Gemmatimonadaceae bacterium]
MMIPNTPDVFALSAGLLIARLVLGLLMSAHGTQKLFGWFGGHGHRREEAAGAEAESVEHPGGPGESVA